MEVDTGTGPAGFLAGMGVLDSSSEQDWIDSPQEPLVTTAPQIHAETYFTPLYMHVFIRLVEMLPSSGNVVISCVCRPLWKYC